MSEVVRVEVFDDLGPGVDVIEGLVPDGYDDHEADIYTDGFEDGVIAALNYHFAVEPDDCP